MKTKIIIGVLVVGAAATGFYFYQKHKERQKKANLVKRMRGRSATKVPSPSFVPGSSPVPKPTGPIAADVIGSNTTRSQQTTAPVNSLNDLVNNRFQSAPVSYNTSISVSTPSAYTMEVGVSTPAIMPQL